MADGTIAAAMNFYLLAGGSSSRMSGPKEDLTLLGSTFLERVASAARPLFDEVVVVRRRGQSPVGGVRNVFDEEHEGAAAIHGVRRALEDAGAGRLWVCAVDRPLLDPGLLGEFRQRFADGSTDLLAVGRNGRVDLLCAGWSASLLPMVIRRIEARAFRLQDILAEASAEIIDAGSLAPSAQSSLANINDRADYERLTREHEG